MEKPLVDQPTIAPTNKLTAAIIAVAFLEVSGLFMRNLFPEWYSTEVWAAIKPIVVWQFAFWFKDQANV